MLTLLYARCSTDKQSESGLGLEVQHRRNAGLMSMLDRGVNPYDEKNAAEFVDDGVSASVPFARRPAAQELMDRIIASYDNQVPFEKDVIVIAYDLSRLFRDVDDGRTMLKWFDDRGVHVFLSNEGGNAIDASSAMGRFLITIRLAQGEFERGLTGERTKAALGALKARGGKVGEAPFGWRSVGDAKHEPNPHEQEIILYMESLETECSLREIARCTNARGYRTRDGKDFTHVQVGRILRRPASSHPAVAPIEIEEGE